MPTSSQPHHCRKESVLCRLPNSYFGAEMGNAKKKRTCPAAGRQISASECGENRHSEYACPADCPYNPFSPESIDQINALNEALNDMIIDRAQSDPTIGLRVMAALALPEGSVDIELRSNDTIMALVHATPVENKRCFFDLFVEETFESMKNDLRTTTLARSKIRLALLEVREVGLKSFTAIDLLRPGSDPIVIMDEICSANVSRFEIILCNVWPMPHFHLLFGPCTSGNFGDLTVSPPEVFETIIRHLGCEATGEEKARWLIEHALSIKMAYVSVNQTRLKRSLEMSDVGFGEYTYRLNMSPLEGINLLQSSSAAQNSPAVPDELETDQVSDILEHFEWTIPDNGPQKNNSQNGRQSIGSVYVTRAGKILAFSKSYAHHSQLGKELEAAFGSGIVIEDSTFSDYAQEQSTAIRIPNPEWVPESLLKNISGLSVDTHTVGLSDDDEGSLDSTWKNTCNKLLDEPRPVLGNQSLREVALIPGLRPLLERVVKDIVRTIDIGNRRYEPRLDIDWIFDELGLPELRCAPPLAPHDHESDTSDDDDDALAFWSDRVDALQKIDNNDRKELLTRNALKSGLMDIITGLVQALPYDPQSPEFGIIREIVTLIWLTIVPENERLQLRREFILLAVQHSTSNYDEKIVETDGLIAFLEQSAIPPLFLVLVPILQKRIESIGCDIHDDLFGDGLIAIDAVTRLIVELIE